MKRRQFFGHGVAGLAFGGLQVGTAAAAGDAVGLPPSSLRQSDAEAYWLRVRKEQFLLPENRLFLNNGSLGVIPRQVLQTVTVYMETAAALELSEYPRWGYERMDEERATMAQFLGCQPEELAFTHNCTESMSLIANGLSLRAGDEVLTTNLEHPGGRCCWDLQAARHGVVVREVEIPHPPRSADELAERLISAIGPRTRVLSFSGILTKTGVILPVRAICEAARAKGVLTVVDGAHMNGQIPVNLKDAGCDYFAGSPHKWMFAPAGCGLLYGRDDSLNRIWPVTVTSGWDQKDDLQAARFQMVGTNNRAIVAGMIAGLGFLQSLGESAVYQRIHALAQHTYREARKRPYLSMVSPEDHTLYGSLVCVDVKAPAAKQRELWQRCQAARIWLLPGERLRLSSHIHTRPSDIDAFFALADEVLG